MVKLKGKARVNANRKRRLKSKNDFFLRKKKLLSNLRIWRDPILEIPCENVDEPEDVSMIIKELKQILKVSRTGIGLAAPQIGYLKRVVVLCPNRKTNNMISLINPEIIETSEEKQMWREGCLSFPDFYADIERPKEVVVVYVDEEKKPQKQRFTGIESVIVQHEVDHLNGICLVGTSWEKSQEEETAKVEATGTYEVVESEDFKREKDAQE